MRILLVEDEEQLNETLTLQLESEGFLIDSCFDGEEACYYGEQNIYDVILFRPYASKNGWYQGSD